MRISVEGALCILHPEVRDPELERRRLKFIEEAERLFPDGVLTPEHLKRGIPLPSRKHREP